MGKNFSLKNTKRRRLYEYRSRLDELDDWTEWKSTTVMSIKKLHKAIRGFVMNTWPEWQERLDAGEVIESRIDGIEREFRRNSG